ncbi:Oidioi.mRNA.OKI2018_I69.chr2.g5434.t1.cds [Oikopleura dioica]|uniref:Oidioi.mRNA.OKI2018_I69.chr2.g5434.t1.cds n=1 Tax=Oikopleura dioica TaxID=34765 RepID=A0ABN7T3Y5_OIKDI|nr:Oidioi.mRNA.OKI2018_I69.chr2.g5434.t1.cds [Oikopleura dioica]
MKASIFLAVTSPSFADIFRGHVKRELTGSWIRSINKQPKNARGGKALVEESLRAEDTSDFRPLAAMMMFLMTENGKYKYDSSDKQDFSEELRELEKQYTNYGCYCWIDGADAGVIGGGKPEDATDFHCKELYRCYKCVGLDYDSDYANLTYTAELRNNPFDRQIDCSMNAKEDAQNICECDKRFAESIAQTRQDCETGISASEKGGTCMNPKLRTMTGGGDFVPRSQCQKEFMNMDRDKCCGIYPNRRPYSSTEQECCEIDQSAFVGEISGRLLEYSVTKMDTCEEQKGGRVVQSAQGNPHVYFELK